MRLFVSIILLVIFLFQCEYLYSQNKDISLALKAPDNSKLFFESPSSSVQSYSSRWFGDALNNSTGTVKSFLNTPGNLSLMFSSARSLFGAARNTAGVYYAIEYLSPGAGNLVTIDTSSGNITTVTALSGLGTGHVLTGMAWDKTSSIMYVTSIDGAAGRLYTLNLSTGALTTVTASMTGTTYPIDIAINNAGVMYSCDITNDVLNIINKSTGAATVVGALGINISFAQGMAFDPNTDSLFLAAFTDAGKLYRCNTSNGSTTLIGNFASGTEIDAFIIPPGPANQLSAFNLQSPSAGARIVTVAGSTTPVTISWDTSATGATYKFIFGNPVVPPRRITLSSNINSITTTLGEFDAILASNGFTNNGSAADSAVGQWDVWAFKSFGAPGVDSLKSANGPRSITLRRQQYSLSSFPLVNPLSPITIITSPVNTSAVTFTWGKSGPGINYKWLFKNSPTYTDPPVLKIASGNSGLDTSLTLRNSQLDSLISGIGVAAGDSTVGVWRVRAYSPVDSLNSNLPDRQITFRRVGLIPLDENFAQTTFPPLFWSLEYTPPLYWSRETPSAFGSGNGSARFKYWSAEAGVTQSLVTNQFPPTGILSYLKFDYAHRFYLDGKNVLAPDSLGIFTSTNNGTNWTLFKTLITTQTPTLGLNSNNNLTTAGGSGEYLAPANTEWATKIFSMPVGINRVKFTAWSAFGNNLFLDNIICSIFDGLQQYSSSLTPEEYKLSQNYPNPFNPSTKINFSIPKQSFVSLKVFDMLGREIAQLVNKELSPNNYSIDFNASNLSSGIYFYQLETADFRDVKRMILIK